MDTSRVEQAALFCLLEQQDSPDMAGMMALLDDADFNNPNFKQSAKAFREIYAQEKHLDFPLLCQNNPAIPFDLILYDSVLQQPRSKDYANYVKELRIARNKEKIEKLGEALMRNPHNADLLAQLRALEFENVQKKNDTKKLDELAFDAVEEILNFDDSKFIRSGFDAIDRAIIGFNPGGLYVFGARPNIGKTSLVCRIALNISAIHRVLFMTTEMSANQILKGRLIPMISKISVRALRVPKNLSEKDKTTLKSSLLTEAEKYRLFVCDNQQPTTSDVALRAEIYAPRIIIIDYLQYMKPDQAADRRLEVSKQVIALKNLAKRLDIPIILTSMAGRTAGQEERPPRMEELSESKDIEATADAVFMMWRPKDSNQKIVEIIIAKNRYGESRTKFSLNFDTLTTDFTENLDGPFGPDTVLL